MRAKRALRNVPVGMSPLTIIILTMGIVLVIYLMFASVGLPACEAAVFYASGWKDRTATLQLVVAIAVLLPLMWLLSVATGSWRPSMFEGAFQLFVIVFIGLVVALYKTQVTPLGFPDRAWAQRWFSVDYLYDWIERPGSGEPVRWTNPNVPPPPIIAPHPRDTDLNPPIYALFRSPQSPTRWEIAEAARCAVDYRAALAEHDRTYREFFRWQRTYMARYDEFEAYAYAFQRTR